MALPLLFDLAEVRSKGRLEASRELPAESVQPLIEEDARLEGPVDVDLALAARGSDVAVSGRARGRWHLECWRCAGPAEQAFAAVLEAELVVRPEVKKVDLTDELRQALLLALPMRPLCRPDCEGLCGVCGGNKNLKPCGCVPR